MTVQSGSHSGSTDTDVTNNPNGSTAQNEGKENQQPQYITVEEFDKKLNSAITGHQKRFEQRFTQTLDDRFTSFQQLLEKALSASQETEEESESSNGNTPNPKPQQSTSGHVPPEVRALQKQLADMQSKLTESEKKAEKEASEKREASIRAKVVEAATQLGSDKGNQIYKLLKDQFDLDEAGNVKFISHEDGYEDIRDLKGGLNDWLQSEEGKHFLPAKNFQGSGASNNASGTAAGRTYTFQELDAMSPKDLAKLDIPKLIAQGKVIPK
jgi:hypothetical protein